MNIHRAVKEKQLLFLFDIDGLLAETPHEEAWKQAAVEWNIVSPDFNFTPFYAEKVAGEPGETGAMNILEHLRQGDDASYFQRERIHGEAARREKAAAFRDPVKQKYLDQRIDRGEFKVFDDIGKMLLLAKLDRVPTAAVSSSETRPIYSGISASAPCASEPELSILSVQTRRRCTPSSTPPLWVRSPTGMEPGSGKSTTTPWRTASSWRPVK
jgi:hypothetical protein